MSNDLVNGQHVDRLAGERHFLKRAWWFFPLMGVLAGLVWKMHGWHWITLDPSCARPFSADLLAAPTVLAAVALFSAAPLAWALGIRFDGKLPPFAKIFTLPFLIALMCVAVADFVLRDPGVQNPFWLGLRARLRPGYADYYARELAYWKLDLLNHRKQGPAVILAGSSQILHGLDFDYLRNHVSPGYTVLRRATAGMDPLKACCAQDSLSARSGDTLILYVSELDLVEVARLDNDWARPLISWRGLNDAASSLGASETRRQWRQIVDLAAACVSELWSCRDYVKDILFHPWGVTEMSAESAEQIFAKEKDHYVVGAREHPYFDQEIRALERLVGRMLDRGVQVVVFEGRVNPVIQTPESMVLREEARNRLADMSRRLKFIYVPESEQRVNIGLLDWLDATHLNKEGRGKLSRYVADFARELVRP